MQVEYRNIKNIQEYPGILRKNDHAVEAVAIAIDTYGFNVPILITAGGIIIDGHLRYKSALSLGLTKVPVIIADHLSEIEIRAFRISVNKVAELANWDFKLLEEEVLTLVELNVDIATLGFSEADLDIMLAGKLPTKDKDELPDQADPIVNSGDLWLLGDHRLFVGDSTMNETYQTLLAGELVDMIWTDPPYNVDYSGKAGKIQNDKMSEENFFQFLLDFYSEAYNFLKPGRPIYVAHADGKPSSAFRQMFVKAGFYYSTCLIWKKHHSTLGRADYHFQHEPILYGWKPGSAHCWYGGRKRKSVIEFGEPPLFSKIDNGYRLTINNEELIITGNDIMVESVTPTIMSFDKPLRSDLHPTMKPVALVEHCLVNSSRPGDIILDSFGGSGTTMIACEERGRKARLIEMDNKYADIIVRRWQEYTGKNAELSTGGTYESLKTERLVYAKKN